jgi:hypothetical protein
MGDGRRRSARKGTRVEYETKKTVRVSQGHEVHDARCLESSSLLLCFQLLHSIFLREPWQWMDVPCWQLMRRALDRLACRHDDVKGGRA